MRIVVDISHPAHVHLFKNFIWRMENRGHKILITASKKESTFELLDKLGFSYADIGSYSSSLVKKILGLPKRDLRMFQVVKRFKPNILIGHGSIRATHVSKILRRPCIISCDDEQAYPFVFPFADVIFGFSGFRKIGSKIVKINGYKELAYLHPKYFKPNSKLFGRKGDLEKEEFIILRFVAFNAYHDIGRWGFDLDSKRKLVKKLEKYAKVLISSEVALPVDLAKHRLSISPEKIHDYLYNARLLVSDSGTMTTEAGILGTPVVRCDSLVGQIDLANFIELEHKYGLIFNFDNPDKAIEKAVELVSKVDLKKDWKEKREKLLKDKIDVIPFMIWFIENYPISFRKMMESPEIQYETHLINDS